MRKAARPLEDDGITVIPVAMGDDADANELENLAPDVLQPPDGTEPDELAKMIMKEIYTGKYNRNKIEDCANLLPLFLPPERVPRTKWVRKANLESYFSEKVDLLICFYCKKNQEDCKV